MSRDDTPEEQTVSVAVVDDEKSVAELVAGWLQELGCSVDVYTDPVKCLVEVKKIHPDIMILDLHMPNVDGMTVLKKVKEWYPSTDVVIITAYANKEVAIEALKLGAFDLIEKPFHRVELVEAVKRTIRYQAMVRERDMLADQLSFVSSSEAKQFGIRAFVGKSNTIQKILDDIRLLQRATDTSVLIMGESGTGKELVARAIHFGSPKSSRPFIPINCSAVPHELAESILFGHVKGAFTGAVTDKKGAFEIAHKGTLFLDEIADMSVRMQAKLLRVLEDGVVEPVGKTGGRRVDVRVIATTNADLRHRLDTGSFRSDLYYRLAGFTIDVPPLRERKEDIPLLAAHFARMFSSEMGFAEPDLSPGILTALQEYKFPGNVRELKNLMERALIESGGNELRVEHLHFLKMPKDVKERDRTTRVSQAHETAEMPLNLQKVENLLIRRALAETDGNIALAARLLGISRTKVYRKLRSAQSE